MAKGKIDRSDVLDHILRAAEKYWGPIERQQERDELKKIIMPMAERRIEAVAEFLKENFPEDFI